MRRFWLRPWTVSLVATGWNCERPTAWSRVGSIPTESSRNRTTLLARAVDSLPLGTAYAIWTGIGTVGTAIFGILVFGEAAPPARLACIGLIVAGIAGLKLSA